MSVVIVKYKSYLPVYFVIELKITPPPHKDSSKSLKKYKIYQLDL